METKKNIRNDLFKRQELVLELGSEKNPSFDEARKIVAEEVSKPEENIDVYGVRGSFGRRVFEIHAYIYDSKDDLKKMLELRKTKKQKTEETKKLEESKKEEAEKASSAKAEEKAKEEKKE